MPNEETPVPFDEAAVLRDLEKLRGQIQEVRSRREQKLAEFDAFVKANRAASQAERLAALDGVAAPAPGVQGGARTAERASSVLGALDEASTPRALPPLDASRNPFDDTPKGRRRVPPLAIASGAVVVVALLAFVYGRSGGVDPGVPSTGGTPAAATPPAAAPAAAAPAPEAPAAAPVPAPRPVQIQLITVRPVWMRVRTDGERQLERQVQAGQTLTFGADREIAVLAGDAGAVRLNIAGADKGPLGRDGQVVNRTFRR